MTASAFAQQTPGPGQTAQTVVNGKLVSVVPGKAAALGMGDEPGPVNASGMASNYSSAEASVGGYIAGEYKNTTAWESSGLNDSLQQMIATGNFSGAFQAASDAGQLEAMLNPENLEALMGGKAWTEEQFQQYYAAFAPYQNKLTNLSQAGQGVADSAWNPYNAGEAAKNWQSEQGGGFSLNPYDVPNPTMFGHSTDPSDLQMTALVAGTGLALAAPVLAPEVGAALGAGAVAGGAVTGAAAGGLTAAGSGEPVLKGAVLGGVGGALAGGAAGDISAQTGIPQSVVSTGIRTGIGAATGGTTGAEAGLISGGVSAGLQEAGVPQGLSGPTGSFLGSAASSALSSPTGGNVVASTNPTLGIDPATSGVVGATSALGMTGTMGMPQMTGTGGSTSPTGVASPATSPSTDLGLESELGTLFGSPTAGSAMSGLGTYGALAGLGIYGANQANASTASTVAPAYAMGQPLVNAGNQLLGEGMAGQLTPLQQQQLTTSQQQGQTLINAATPVGQIAQQYMKQFQSGNLLPADQAALDQSVTASKAQLAQALGPNVDSTTMATYSAQIDQQALITKQTMLNSYLATGNQEFDQWATTTEAGQATIAAGQAAAVANIDQTFNEAFQASATGQSPIMQAIQDTLQSNAQIANALQQYMGNLTKGYALQKAASTVAGGGAAGVAGGAASQVAGDTGQGYNLSDIGSTPVNVNAGATAGGALTPAQQVEQGQESALFNSMPDSGGATSYGINDSSAPATSSLQSVYSGPSFSSQASSGMASYSNFAGGSYYA
jgi:hypothetical protein